MLGQLCPVVVVVIAYLSSCQRAASEAKYCMIRTPFIFIVITIPFLEESIPA